MQVTAIPGKSFIQNLLDLPLVPLTSPNDVQG